jgi:hypothetical protein
MQQLKFIVGGKDTAARVDDLIVAGWTGRDRAALEHHIAELAAIGVKRPRATPCFYRMGANLLTHDETIEVVGTDTSGEVEFVLVALPAGLHVAVGSDHTDRRVEAYGVTVSKQLCPKPLSRELWSMRDLEDHWDELVLRSWVTRGGLRELYQEGSVAKMLAPDDLTARYLGHAGALPPGTLMYCGTLPALGAIGAGERFELELEDPRLKRKLRHAYTTRCLAIAD